MTITKRILKEKPARGGHRLGRHVDFDSRSRKFPVSALRLQAAIASKTWTRRIWPWDQGNVGACVGFGAAGLLATWPFRKTTEAGINAKLGMRLYSEATTLDPWPGSYPPDDTGSSILAGMKALKAIGKCREYRWCFGLDDVLRTISSYGPVEVGVNWYSSFDRPDASGVVKLDTAAWLRGGHAFDLIGVDVAKQQVVAVNSWGTTWGARGRFRFSWADLDRLLREDGEASTVVR